MGSGALVLDWSTHAHFCVFVLRIRILDWSTRPIVLLRIRDFSPPSQEISAQDRKFLVLHRMRPFTSLLLIYGGCSSSPQRSPTSQLPANPIEPVGQWIWGKLVNGFVYNAPRAFGGGNSGAGSGGASSPPSAGRASGSRPFSPAAGLPTTGEVLATDDRFSTLLAAITTAFPNGTNLEPPFTVFAPTNAAFAKLPEGSVEKLLEDPESLRDVLLRHIVAGKAVRIGAGSENHDTAGGGSIGTSRSLDDIYSESVTVKSGSGTALVKQFDIQTSDGVIHAIDTVI